MKIQSRSQIFRYGQSIFCLPHRPKFSDKIYLCLHWVSVVPEFGHKTLLNLSSKKKGRRKSSKSYQFSKEQKWQIECKKQMGTKSPMKSYKGKDISENRSSWHIDDQTSRSVPYLRLICLTRVANAKQEHVLLFRKSTFGRCWETSTYRGMLLNRKFYLKLIYSEKATKYMNLNKRYACLQLQVHPGESVIRYINIWISSDNEKFLWLFRCSYFDLWIFDFIKNSHIWPTLVAIFSRPLGVGAIQDDNYLKW